MKKLLHNFDLGLRILALSFLVGGLTIFLIKFTAEAIEHADSKVSPLVIYASMPVVGYIVVSIYQKFSKGSDEKNKKQWWQEWWED